MTNLVLFDMDHTLVSADTSNSWNEFLYHEGFIDKNSRQQRIKFWQDYVNGVLDLDIFYHYEIEILKSIPKVKRLELRTKYISQIIVPHILAKGQSEIAKHKTANKPVVIITATVSFLARAVAEAFNVDAVICTEEEIIHNEYTGKVLLTPCMGKGKLVNLKNWLTTHQLTPTKTTFYSDSHNDLPLLNEVDIPIAVDPDPILTQVATDKNWPIISFR
jgi:HAD superfamily hydrolase (TIGR01490 family)